VDYAEPAQCAASLRFGTTLLKTDDVSHFDRYVHVLFESTAIISIGNRRLERHRSRRNQIFASQIQSIYAEFQRRDVDQTFEHIDCFRSPGTTIRAGRLRIGVDGRDGHMRGWRLVTALKAADIHTGRHHARTAGEIGT
jgi:hypothetical protein